MSDTCPEQLGIIAGKGVYPRLFAEAARAQGVARLFAVAFEKETDPVIERCADEVRWLKIGQLQALLDAFQSAGVQAAVMVGQITPTHLFRVRPDKAMLSLLASLKTRNADTIFGAVGDALRGVGVELMPAHMFMESAMPDPGVLTRRAPTETEQQDIELGLRVAKTTSGLEIGQTVVVKEGTILAIEAFEGTDAAIERAGALGGAGAVVVKAAKRGHDMRFDIPVIGERSLKSLKRAKAAVLAVEANRTILLERDKIVRLADKQGLCIVAVATEKDNRHE
jgi:DUF1009 family protein